MRQASSNVAWLSLTRRPPSQPLRQLKASFVIPFPTYRIVISYYLRILELLKFHYTFGYTLYVSHQNGNFISGG